jgi:methylenetetrahydrofolate dehydrogenase (NADP+)/methenyltetrahydrofolate cyclohydrolase
MAQIIDGKKAAAGIIASLKAKIGEAGIAPRLAVILAGNSPASEIYVKNKEKTAADAGIETSILRFPEDAPEKTLLSKIGELNADTKIHGVLVQMPLPGRISAGRIVNAVSPEKDVDGFHPLSIGRLVLGEDGLRPCTPSAVIHLIESTGIGIAGKNAVVIGRSNIVGKPVALMLLQKNATVTICHSKTAGLPLFVGGADILVAAIGKAQFIKGSWIKRGAVVIDVGISRQAGGKIEGDVEFGEASKRAAFITPVPGGVGPVTIAMLMRNTVEAAHRGGTRC